MYVRQHRSLGSADRGRRFIERRLLRHEIRRELIDAVLCGRLSAGENVTETELAEIEAVAGVRQRTAFDLEAEWNEGLLALGDNEELRKETARYRDRALRYERAFGRTFGVLP